MSRGCLGVVFRVFRVFGVFRVFRVFKVFRVFWAGLGVLGWVSVVGCRVLFWVWRDKNDPKCNMGFDYDTFTKKCSKQLKILSWTKMM